MKVLIIGAGLVFALSACKEQEVARGNPDMNSTITGLTPDFDPAGMTMLSQGSFQNAVHATSGVAKIYEDKDKKRTLVIENFNTDAGPDLRIYLAEDRSVTNFIELTDKVQNGKMLLPVPANADLKKQNHVLVWCRKYSVLFGFAALN